MKIVKIVLIGIAVYAALAIACLAVQKTVVAFSGSPRSVGRRPQILPNGSMLNSTHKKGFMILVR